MKLRPEEITAILRERIEQYDVETDLAEVGTVLQLVAEKGRAAELEEIAREFERLMAREERRLTVELTTARELTEAETEAILKQIEDAAGRKVEATQKVDPDLVGGIVLQAGSLRVDASVRGRLERLRNELVRS